MHMAFILLICIWERALVTTKQEVIQVNVGHLWTQKQG